LEGLQESPALPRRFLSQLVFLRKITDHGNFVDTSILYELFSLLQMLLRLFRTFDAMYVEPTHDTKFTENGDSRYTIYVERTQDTIASLIYSHPKLLKIRVSLIVIDLDSSAKDYRYVQPRSQQQKKDCQAHRTYI
jgi:hypothetical protein